jgi:CRISPR/Cas system CSM-associated protein Csm4 (group 5 of RAMP superfamily)
MTSQKKGQVPSHGDYTRSKLPFIHNRAQSIFHAPSKTIEKNCTAERTKELKKFRYQKFHFFREIKKQFAAITACVIKSLSLARTALHVTRE